MSGKKATVVFVTHWATRLGGAEISLLDLLKGMAKSDCCHLITTENGPLVDRAREYGVRCHVLPCEGSIESIRRNHTILTILRYWKTILFFLQYCRKLSRLLSEIQPNVIHANVPKSHIAVLLCRVAGMRIPVCLHIREIFDKNSFPYLLYRMLCKAGCRIVAISHAVKDSLPVPLQKNAVVIYNGISVPTVLRTRADQACVKLVYIGRVVPWKGCEFLVRTFKHFTKVHCEVQASLSIVGDTSYWSRSYRDELELLIGQLGISGSCRLLPHTQSPYEVLIDHDVFCTASRNEPFGRSVAEAQACGLPVVGFRTGGVPEIVRDGVSGILVQEDDLEAFSHALFCLAHDRDLLCRMGTAGRERVSRLFARDRQVEAIRSELLRSSDFGSSAVTNAPHMA